MALAPKFAGHKFAAGGSQPVHTLELYLDYVCPFSKKQFDTVYNSVFPLIEKKYSSKIQIIFRQQIQPWSVQRIPPSICPESHLNPSYLKLPTQHSPQHPPQTHPKPSDLTIARHPSSTLVHEAGLAVLKTDASKFYPFSAALFAKQTEYFDVSVVNETRNATYKRLAKLASSVDVDEAKVYGLLEISDKPGKDGALNSGNGVTDDLKLLVKQARLVGIHVSPTVLFDGLVENNISSSWTVEQWDEWLQKNVAQENKL